MFSAGFAFSSLLLFMRFDVLFLVVFLAFLLRLLLLVVVLSAFCFRFDLLLSCCDFLPHFLLQRSKGHALQQVPSKGVGNVARGIVGNEVKG